MNNINANFNAHYKSGIFINDINGCMNNGNINNIDYMYENMNVFNNNELFNIMNDMNANINAFNYIGGNYNINSVNANIISFNDNGNMIDMNNINIINNRTILDSTIPMKVIKNSSNNRETSYINSVLQSLFSIDCINDWLNQLYQNNLMNNVEDCLTNDFYQLFLNLCLGKGIIYSTDLIFHFDNKVKELY